MEIVHDGWLLKSPPPKRLWRAKWRNRWFVLRSGELPGQYFLEYYTDDTRKKLKGKIDLDQCEQVDAGITFAHRKFEYKFMFDIKTPKRIYYLCAETEEAMNRWVDCVCQVCGLKVMNQEDMVDPLAQLHQQQQQQQQQHYPSSSSTPSTPQTTVPPMSFDAHHRLMEYPCVDSPPPSASSNISGPYIPISECITGKKSSTGSSANTTRFPFAPQDVYGEGQHHPQQQRSSIPNEMAPPAPFVTPSSVRSPPQMQRQNSSGRGALPKDHYDLSKQFRPSAAAASDDSLSIHSPPSLGPAEGFYVFFSDEEKALNPSQQREDPDGKATKGKASTLFSAVGVSSADAEGGGSAPPPFAAPPRPPKPAHLSEASHHLQQNYMNVGTVMKSNSGRSCCSSSGANERSRSLGSSSVTHLGVPQDGTVSSSDAEPSPASVGSSVVSKDVSDDSHDFHPSRAEWMAGTCPGPGGAAPSERTRRYGFFNNAPSSQGRFFSYDTHQHQQYPSGSQNSSEKLQQMGDTDPRISPLGIYSNVLPATKESSYVPPAVDRGLKPKKPSDSSSHSASELSAPSGSLVGGSDIPSMLGAVGGTGIPVPPASAPPIVDRNLKPQKKISDPIIGLNPPLFVLDPAPRSKLRNHDQRKPRAAPSPTPPSLRNGRGNAGSDTDADSSLSSPNSRRDSVADEQIQYLDLDLETHQGPPGSPKGSKSAGGMPKLVPAEASVVYKKVDFVKTEAFNQMRQNVEESYRTGKTSN